MGHVRTEIRIKAPLDHVWDLAMKTERIPDYNPYMETTSFSGPLDVVGTTFSSAFKLLGRTSKGTGTVVEVIPHKLLRLKGHDEHGGDTEWTYRFQPVDQGVFCTLDVDYSPKSFVGEILDRLILERALERSIRHMAENFAALAESTVLQPA